MQLSTRRRMTPGITGNLELTLFAYNASPSRMPSLALASFGLAPLIVA
jgi:hypothetical protein